MDRRAYRPFEKEQNGTKAFKAENDKEYYRQQMDNARTTSNPREKIRVCYLIFLMSEKLSKQYRDEWRSQILKLLDIDESYYRSKYKEPVSDFPSDSNQKFAKEMESIFG